MQTNYFPTGLRNDWVMWLAIGMLIGAGAFAVLIDHPPAVDVVSVDCEEDDVWMFVDHDTPGGLVDLHGVTRACRNFDDMVDMAIEVAIQRDVLMYVPNP